MTGARGRLARVGLAGALAGTGAAGCMYAGDWLGVLVPLPALLQEPILQAMPGPVFGFLIDRLQHAGKVLEEAGLIAAMVAALAVLAAVHDVGVRRWRLPASVFLPAAAAWALTALVALPLAGDGVGGLGETPTTPILWALVYLVYGGLLEIARPAPGPRPAALADPVRRRLLSLLPAGAALAGAGLVGYRLVPGWVEAIAAPPEAGLAGAAPEVTPARSFYIVSKNFQDPSVPAGGWSLGVRGLVERPFGLSYRELQAQPGTTEVVTLECVSNGVGGALMSTIAFTGAPLRDLVARARPLAEADALAFHCRDGYVETLPLALVMRSPEILVAHGFGGRPLPREHGYPARLLVPGRYGLKSAKWLDWIELTRGERTGYWARQGFDRSAVVRTTARLDVPRDGAVVRAGRVTLAGVAFAGDRGIGAVEWSADSGRTWSRARLQAAPSPYAWALWSAAWEAGREGSYTLVVRARDGLGEPQASRASPSFPSGAGGYHRARVNVGG